MHSPQARPAWSGPPLGCFLALVLLTAAAAAGAGEKEYRVRLQRPDKAGDTYQIDAKVDSQVTTTITAGTAEPKKQERATHLELRGAVSVVRANAEGYATQLACTVDRCIEDGKPLFGKGTVIHTESHSPRPQFTVNGNTVDEKAAEALGPVLDTREPGNGDSDDAVLGTDRPRKVGDSWPVNSELVAKAISKRGLPADKDGVKGTAKFVAVKQVGGRDALQVDVDISIDFAGREFEGLKVQSGTASLHLSYLVPAEENQRVISEFMSMKVNLQAKGQGPDGQPLTVDVTGGDSADSTFGEPGKL